MGYDNDPKNDQSQPNASQVAKAVNKQMRQGTTNATSKRVRRGGVYKNSVTKDRLESISFDKLLTGKVGKYFYVSVGLFHAFQKGGKYIHTFALEAEHFVTNVNINIVCRDMYDYCETGSRFALVKGSIGI